MKRLAVVILAAGKGTRMISKKQKILHEVGGKPMVTHLFEAAEAAATMPPVIVVSAEEHGVQDLLGERASYLPQVERLGTGHAAQMVAPFLQGKCDQVVITYADMPLLKTETIAALAAQQTKTGAAVVMLSFFGEESSTFGRVARDEAGCVMEIVEVAEAKQRSDSERLLAIRELNPGVYCFDAEWLWANLPNLELHKARVGYEYYLTDMIGMAAMQGLAVDALPTMDEDECLGAGTRTELIAVDEAFRRRANRRWLANGVTLIDPDSTYIDQDVTIGQDTIIWPNSYLQGTTAIGEDCVIGPGAIVRDAQVGDNCRIEQCVVEGVMVSAETHLPPFTHLKSKES